MKRIITICLLLSFCFTLFGCKAEASQYIKTTDKICSEYNLSSSNDKIKVKTNHSTIYKGDGYYVVSADCKNQLDSDNLFSSLKSTASEDVNSAQLWLTVLDSDAPIDEFVNEDNFKMYRMHFEIPEDDFYCHSVVIQDGKSVFIAAATNKEYKNVVETLEKEFVGNVIA